MGKGRRKSNTNKLRNISNRTASKIRNCPEVPKTQTTNFKMPLLEKIFDTAKQILDNSNNIEEWRRLNLEGLITISMGDLVATERILLRAIRFPECGVKPYKNLVSVYSQMGRLRDALPLAQKAHDMEPDSLDIGLLYINCLLDLARADDVIKVADKLLLKNENHRQLMLAKASALRAGFAQKNHQNLPIKY